MNKQQDNKNNRPAEFIPQEAPNKNTDNAFVKVGRDGQPEMPAPGEEKKEKPEERAGNRP